MKLIRLVAPFAVSVIALPRDRGEWIAPQEGDVRGPCPMLNTLANHGYLPRDGKGISRNIAIEALDTAINWDVSVVGPLYDFAQPVNPAPNATTIDLNQLTTHNILEHDGSLSRQDAFFGPADVFHEETWNETLSYFTTPNITVSQAARARTARVVTAASTNPSFTFPQLGAYFDYGETAAYQFVFGTWNLEADDIKDKISTSLEMVEYFFKFERLPLKSGWGRPINRLTIDILIDFVLEYQVLTRGQMNGTIPY
ncbi:heme-thiolate peroxidase [Xylaria arbuscula]|uniref:Heme-thiolate peroxidase n=1 Tax=Xylaria arbuscula TaxID=114810 RepID=A0A9W8TJU6_9PEZI|nr:heme-thiolate peroxidase [Xylaria arbuscula]